MQIVVILLLAVALGLLVLGLIGADSALVVGSILASLLAVALIVRARRDRIGQPAAAAVAHRTGQPVKQPTLRPASGVGRHAATRPADDPAPADDAEQDPPAADTAAPLSGHGQHSVWVIDGRPRYHLASCDFLLGRADQPIPLSQAVEDGFTPCSRCDPDNRL